MPVAKVGDQMPVAIGAQHFNCEVIFLTNDAINRLRHCGSMAPLATAAMIGGTAGTRTYAVPSGSFAAARRSSMRAIASRASLTFAVVAVAAISRYSRARACISAEVGSPRG